MKGQRLFVRPLVPTDFDDLVALHSAAGETPPAELRSSAGLVGRLAGSTVAVLAWRRDGDAMALSWLFVASDLRGLRIGRQLLAEAEAIAASEGASVLRVEQGCKLARYFELRGFVSVEESLIRTIR